MSKTPNHVRRHIDISLTQKDMDDFIKQTKKNRKGILIAPFEVFLGAVKNTNYGEVGNVEPATQTTFQLAFTGQDDVLVVWENSTSAKKLNEEDDFLTKEYQIGRTIIGMQSVQQGLSTFAKKADPSLSDFTIQQASISISIIFESEELSFNDLFKFYVIPQSGTNQYLYISQLITYTSPSGQKMQEVIFSSVNDFLESTGNAISQYIQNTGMGSGYAFPKIAYTEEGEVVFQLDQNRLTNIPITNIQIEIYGPAIFMGALVMGRPSTQLNKKIVAPRMLFNHEFLTPIGSSITNKSTGENNYKVIYNAKIDAVGYYNEWTEKVESKFDEGAKKKFEGTIETSIDQVDSTNDGNDYLNVWSTEWKHNALIETGGDYDTPENRLTEGTVSFKEGANYHNHFNTMAMIQMGQTKLPIGLKETTIWNLKDIPVVGGFLNLFTLGYPVGWQNTDSIFPGKPFCGFISATLYDFLANLGLDETAGVIPVDAFRDEESDPVSSFIGASATTTIFRWGLTDIGEKDGTVIGTIDMGQEGGWKFNGQEEWLNPSLEPDQGYEIDLIDPIILGHADYKITAFNEENALYSSIHSTRAKYTGTIREHHNTTKHSNWTEIDGEQIDYPAAIIDPIDPGSQGSLPDRSFNIDVINERIFKGTAGVNQPTNTIGQEGFIEKIGKSIDVEGTFGKTIQDFIDEGYKYLKIETTTSQKWNNVISPDPEVEVKKVALTDLINNGETWTYIVSNPTELNQKKESWSVIMYEFVDPPFGAPQCEYDKEYSFSDSEIRTGANGKVRLVNGILEVATEILLEHEDAFGIPDPTEGTSYCSNENMKPGTVQVGVSIPRLTITQK